MQCELDVCEGVSFTAELFIRLKYPSVFKTRLNIQPKMLRHISTREDFVIISRQMLE